MATTVATTSPPFHLLLSLFFLFSLLVHANPINTNHANPIARRSVTVNLAPNPDYAPNGPAAYARALQKWGAEVPQSLAQSLAVMKGAAYSVKEDREYLSRVGFGTPLQWLDVDLDTGSADVWVYSSETRKSVAGNRPVWVIEDSKTARKVENTTWMISYGDGSRAWGNVWTDTICLGSITLPNATLESAVSASSSLTFDPDLDGIFGLSYSLPSETTPQQPTSTSPNASSTAIVDTGTTLLLLSQEITSLYYASIPTAIQNFTVGGLWTFPCNLTTLPDFEIGFDSGFVATVQEVYELYGDAG
ncbi:hypothetical protein N0V88_000667 [Collariella sp. IMI 366227]|nr:hypothetical protein N0V88_000667 [Collariella sp. IMI 366227]